jgi:hypothetical protein
MWPGREGTVLECRPWIAHEGRQVTRHPTLAALALLLWGCSSSAAPASGPSLDDITSANPTIQTAAAAVVLVTMPGFVATGSFISPDGLLLTNNHVLGVGVCPIEGCYVQLTWNYQRGARLSQPVTVFAVPKAVDVGLDMAVLQASSAPGGPPLSTPSYLTIDSRDPASLLGIHVTVVGHPEGSVKKWSQGQVVDADGTWITTSVFVLPGNSGSPLLDDHGHIVGLMHRSPEGEDLIADDGLNASSIGTASSALIAAMSAPLPGSMGSTAAPVTDAEVVSNQLLYLASRVPTARVGGADKQVLASLGEACDAALAVKDYASPDDLSAALEPCFDAEQWIECRSDARTSFGVCPDDAAAWQSRYEAMYQALRSLNGELDLDEMSFAEAALSSTTADGQFAAEQLLTQAVAVAQPPLDFHVASYLAAFGVDTYRGASVVDFTRNYGSVPDYAADGQDLASTILWLSNTGAIGYADTKSLLSAVHGDRTIDLGTKLFIELAEYNRGILP